MTSTAERERTIDVADVVEHIKARLHEWKVSDADVLWSIRKGGAQPNAKSSKQLLAAAQYGGSRLAPYDAGWLVKGNSAILDALNVIEAELSGKTFAAPA